MTGKPISLREPCPSRGRYFYTSSRTQLSWALTWTESGLLLISTPGTPGTPHVLYPKLNSSAIPSPEEQAISHQTGVGARREGRPRSGTPLQVHSLSPHPGLRGWQRHAS